MKIAHGTNRDVDPEYGVEDIDNSPPGHPVNPGEISGKGRDARTESSTNMLGNLSPCLGAALAPTTVEMILFSTRLDLRDVHHLEPKVFPFLDAARALKSLSAMLTRAGKYILKRVHFLHGNQTSVRALMSRLSTRLAILGFLGRSGPWLAGTI